jgi:hypothetical protein
MRIKVKLAMLCIVLMTAAFAGTAASQEGVGEKVGSTSRVSGVPNTNPPPS